MNHIQRIRNTFSLGIKPTPKLDIVTWAKKHVKMANSRKSDKADLLQTPWLIEPINKIIENNDLKEVIICAPTGSGKTTANVIIGTYIVAENPKTLMFIDKSDPDANEFLEVNLKPALIDCELIKPLWPKQKNRIRKDFLNFAHMVVYVGGANMSNLQSRSIDLCIADEVFLYKQGMIAEMRKRNHDRPFAKCVLTSQGSFVGDDFHKAYEQCQIYEFCYKCPSCGNNHPWVWDQLKWEADKTPNDETIWETVNCWYECPCGHVFEDTPQDRRAMTDSGSYQPMPSKNPLPGHVAFHYTALSNYSIPFKTLAIEFIQTKENHSNYNGLQVFKQKRMAEFWSNENLITNKLQLGEYTLAEAQDNPWDLKIMTVDVQKDRLYYVIRDWTKQGASRLVDCGMVINYSDIENLRIRYNIKQKAVFVDSSYNEQECKNALADYGWLGLNGRGEQTFRWKDKGRTVFKSYSTPKAYTIGRKGGTKVVQITNYNSTAFKDILAMVQNNTKSRWEIPSDVSESYKFMMNSEIRILDDSGKPTYKCIREDNNHYFDCETMNVMAALLWNYLYVDTTVSGEE